MVREHNHEVRVNKYLNRLGFSNKKIGKIKEEYNLCYILEVLYTGGGLEKVMFAYKHDSEYNYSKYNFHPDMIKGGKAFNHEVEGAIYRFCEEYGQYLLQGYDIVDIALNDPNNFLNYQGDKKINKVKVYSNIKRSNK